MHNGVYYKLFKMKEGCLMENLLKIGENFDILKTDELEEINGGIGSGNIFKDAGWVIGKGLYYACKGLSTIKG
jgi:hypothetical protein